MDRSQASGSRAEPCVAVIIAAKDAAATIGRAIASALAEPEVAQVIVIDDGSRDRTRDAALRADDGSGRLMVERFETNRGPSAARNHALAIAAAPIVAILDADDAFLKGRFAALLARPDWDIIADNILFVPDGTDLASIALPPASETAEPLSLAAFIDRCVVRGTRARAQLGFLKPLIRRDRIADNLLRYDEEVRLGEDFLLYATLLAHGARFLLSHDVGYLAVERPGSLSARHGVSDLAVLLDAEQTLARRLPLSPLERRAFARRISETRGKWAHRHFLALKMRRGLAAAVGDLARHPADWLAVTAGIGRDKFRPLASRMSARPQEAAAGRLLFAQSGASAPSMPRSPQA